MTIFFKNYRSIQTLSQVHDNIHRNSVKEETLLMSVSITILILGLEPLLSIAAELYFKRKRIGYYSKVEPLIGYERLFKIKRKNDVAFIISSFANGYE